MGAPGAPPLDPPQKYMYDKPDDRGSGQRSGSDFGNDVDDNPSYVEPNLVTLIPLALFNTIGTFAPYINENFQLNLIISDGTEAIETFKTAFAALQFTCEFFITHMLPYFSIFGKLLMYVTNISLKVGLTLSLLIVKISVT